MKIIFSSTVILLIWRACLRINKTIAIPMMLENTIICQGMTTPPEFSSLQLSHCPVTEATKPFLQTLQIGP